MLTHLNDEAVHEMYHSDIKESLEQSPYAKHLGMSLTELGPGTASAVLTPAKHMLNSHGTVHGAVIFSLADYAFEAASNSYGKIAVGITTNVSFMSSGKLGQTLKATAAEEKKNHRLAWYKINVYSDNELIATMEAMVYRKKEYFIDVK
ncbi:acyl-CoA thioesterase [Bacillus ectoiniformans]|uniref:PaaI family thioesterase n=1 Tax=Bacillus ectoiniformans TaxID=1494429 RepID=UPI00195A4F7F|nr:hotdog fold thioesterase [Bacillus ectoiniformans]MBM7649155.1 acyl-CoA thioesterase [Bacillus ectoiniformans]